MIRVKTAKQIDGIRVASRFLVEVLTELEQRVEPGVTTRRLDGIAREMLEKMGARPAFLGYMGFPAALCTSVDSAVIHGIPDDTPLVEGQVVGIDCGVEYRGYYSDSAITVPVGDVSTEVRRLMEVTKESLALGIEKATAGNRVSDISRAIYEHVTGHGYGVVRPYCGHGVGLDIHEDPQIPNYISSGPNPRLKNGMVIAIEPMINLGGDDVDVLDDDWTVVTTDRSISAHFEHTVAVGSDGAEILTSRSGGGV
ncbi:MAG: type I methionyl aminopeptidase [Spirochaetaceae bacterium]